MPQAARPDVDTSNAIIRPPIAWALAFAVGLGLDWLYPLPFVPASISSLWVGGAIFAIGLALAIWAIVTIHKAGSRVETYKPTTMIVSLAVGFNSLWLLVTLLGFYFVIRHGVVAREEAYLERKFGDVYRRYRTTVRRWL
jgi:protein-S-isoprenylcysteine O-methyltransferase Ste14